MLKKIIILGTLITLISTFAVGCGNETSGNDDTTAKVEATTPEPTTPEVTTPEATTPEPTTEEPTTPEETTEEPSTEYVYKGEQFAISSTYKDVFANVVVEKGHKFAVNSFVDESASDVVRGKFSLDLVEALFTKNNYDKVSEFVDTYWEVGASVLEISYSQNVVIEYNEDVKIYFYLVKDNGKYAYFDVYEID